MVWWEDRIFLICFECMWERWGILGSTFSETILAFLLNCTSWENEYSGVLTPWTSVHSSVDVHSAQWGLSAQLTMFKPLEISDWGILTELCCSDPLGPCDPDGAVLTLLLKWKGIEIVLQYWARQWPPTFCQEKVSLGKTAVTRRGCP